MSIQLKVKIKTLAEESRIIRKEELKARNMARSNRAFQDAIKAEGASELRYSLHYHRVVTVRKEARASQLAYGYLRGKKYSEIESSVREGNEPKLDPLVRLVIRFGGVNHKVLLKAWLKA